VPYKVMYAAFRASFNAARKAGLIDNYDLTNAGDDNHFILFHRKGVDNPDIHGLAFHTFFRAGWVIQQLGYKTYGHMQDFVDEKLSALIKAGKLYAHADLDDAFMAELKAELAKLPEGDRWAAIEKGYEEFKSGKASGALQELYFSGNVRGMGIGFAEKSISAAELARFPEWSVIANDKGAAGAFNYPTYWATRIALLLRQILAEQTAAEIAAGTYAGKETMEWLASALEPELAARMPEVPEALRRELAVRWGNEAAAATLGAAEFFEETIKHGLVFETWEVLPNSRAFVDAESEDSALLTMLSAQNEHNIKRIWTKKRTGWINDLTAEEVAAIESRVDSELPSLRTEYEQRKAQLQRDGRSPEIMNPWERKILELPMDELVAGLRSRLVEQYKVQEFLGDDFIAAVSTEKLAAVTGGAYVGKDDSVMITLDPFADLYRAVTKAAVRVNIGNARGSHWVAMRPEGARERTPGELTQRQVAVKWSNPIEVSLRYRVDQTGAVATDAGTGLANGEDIYGQPVYDVARERVIKFNEMWIDSQGGFTPHGPNVERDVEAAYPARQTVDRITAKDSPFALDVTDETLASVEQGQLVEQFPNAGYTLTPEVAVQAADLGKTRWVVIHSSVFTDNESPALVIDRIRRQLDRVVGSGQRGLRFALAIDGAKTPEDAERLANVLTAAIPQGSKGRARLVLETFDLIVPADLKAGELLGRVEGLAEGSTVGGVVGPTAWSHDLKQASREPEKVTAVAYQPATEQEVGAGAEAIIVAVEGVAGEGKIPPALAKRLDAQLNDSGLFEVAPLPKLADTAVAVDEFSATVRQAFEGA